MKPTERLSAEHRVIEKALGAVEGVALSVQEGGKLPVEDARRLVRFIRRYADARHHGKEENQLFAHLAANGWSTETGPIAVMLAEHEMGRDLTRQMHEAVGKQDGRNFAEAALEYVGLLRRHIAKEDNILFPMAEQSLGDKERKELNKRFDAVNDELARTEDPAVFEELAETLSARYPKRSPELAAGSGCLGGCR